MPTSYNHKGKTINREGRGLSWRLVYSGSNLISYFESEGITQTPYTLEAFPNETTLLNRISTLDLNTGSLDI